jgi:L-ribulose-5-phosphate 3-epimerase
VTRRISLGASFGVMQGRLSPQTHRGYQAFPMETWESEFPRAAQRGLEHIEWIIDHHDTLENPIIRDSRAISQLSSASGVCVVSVCADYFMQYPLLEDVSSRDEVLYRILEGMNDIGAHILVLPCVDQASLLAPGAIQRTLGALERILPRAADAQVTVAIECDLPPHRLAQLLEELSHSNLGVNYDSGNSAALGYRWQDELQSYGDRIVLIHVKDRLRSGGSVPLGSGDAEIESVLTWMKQKPFGGPVTLQAYRDTTGVEILDEQLQWLAQRV